MCYLLLVCRAAVLPRCGLQYHPLPSSACLHSCSQRRGGPSRRYTCASPMAVKHRLSVSWGRHRHGPPEMRMPPRRQPNSLLSLPCQRPPSCAAGANVSARSRAEGTIAVCEALCLKARSRMCTHQGRHCAALSASSMMHTAGSTREQAMLVVTAYVLLNLCIPCRRRSASTCHSAELVQVRLG